MGWEKVDIDENFEQVTGIPTVQRVNVKVEDVHRMDLPGCAKHPTAGAIQQHTSWSDPDGTRHNRWTGYTLCADCGIFIDQITPQSIARSEYDT